MQLVHKTGAEQGVVQFAAAFAQQPPHAPFLPQPAQGRPKINFAFAADLYFVRNRTQLPEFAFEVRAVVKMMTGEKCFLKMAARGLIEPLPLTTTRKWYSASPRLSRRFRNFSPPVPKNGPRNFNRPRAAHHRVRRGAEFVEMFQVALGC